MNELTLFRETFTAASISPLCTSHADEIGNAKPCLATTYKACKANYEAMHTDLKCTNMYIP